MGVRPEARPAVPMHLPLLSTVTSILWAVAGVTSALRPSGAGDSLEDCRSCLDCSHDNGCVRCPERLFLFLQRDGMSHHGVCLQACPPGHYGQRGKQANTCMRCKSVDCEQCFSRDFCTRCRPGLQLHKGRCLTRCPPHTFSHHGDCVEDCKLVPGGEWGEWTACLRGGAPCGFRWGRRTRTREPEPHTPEEQSGPPCPPHRERRSCRMKKRCETGSSPWAWPGQPLTGTRLRE
ncbi:unnamed protein product [Merluccius merluccius]